MSDMGTPHRTNIFGSEAPENPSSASPADISNATVLGTGTYYNDQTGGSNVVDIGSGDSITVTIVDTGSQIIAEKEIEA